jgi:DNA polymerase
VLVGEQPGEAEDRAGVPFVGPAGALLDRALTAAGIARDDTFVTNAVKHFKWIPRGKRRIHKTPAQREIAACLDWMDDELRLLQPDAVVCLGATATHALLGPAVKVTRDRGKTFSSPRARAVIVTVHPSSILRSVGAEERAHAFELFVRDLRRVADLL